MFQRLPHRLAEAIRSLADQSAASLDNLSALQRSEPTLPPAAPFVSDETFREQATLEPIMTVRKTSAEIVRPGLDEEDSVAIQVVPRSPMKGGDTVERATLAERMKQGLFGTHSAQSLGEDTAGEEEEPAPAPRLPTVPEGTQEDETPNHVPFQDVTVAPRGPGLVAAHVNLGPLAKLQAKVGEVQGKDPQLVSADVSLLPERTDKTAKAAKPSKTKHHHHKLFHHDQKEKEEEPHKHRRHAHPEHESDKHGHKLKRLIHRHSRSSSRSSSSDAQVNPIPISTQPEPINPPTDNTSQTHLSVSSPSSASSSAVRVERTKDITAGGATLEERLRRDPSSSSVFGETSRSSVSSPSSSPRSGCHRETTVRCYNRNEGIRPRAVRPDTVDSSSRSMSRIRTSPSVQLAAATEALPLRAKPHHHHHNHRRSSFGLQPARSYSVVGGDKLPALDVQVGAGNDRRQTKSPYMGRDVVQMVSQLANPVTCEDLKLLKDRMKRAKELQIEAERRVGKQKRTLDSLEDDLLALQKEENRLAWQDEETERRVETYQALQHHKGQESISALQSEARRLKDLIGEIERKVAAEEAAEKRRVEEEFGHIKNRSVKEREAIRNALGRLREQRDVTGARAREVREKVFEDRRRLDILNDEIRSLEDTMARYKCQLSNFGCPHCQPGSDVKCGIIGKTPNPNVAIKLSKTDPFASIFQPNDKRSKTPSKSKISVPLAPTIVSPAIDDTAALDVKPSRRRKSRGRTVKN